MNVLNTLTQRQAQQQGTHRNGPSSVSQLWNTLAPILIIAIIIFAIFLVLQKKNERIYGPRTYLGALHQWQRSPKRSTGVMGWRKEYCKLKDEFVLGHSSLDNYLWLRFFKMLVVMSFVGTLITWPILFPVNATGGGAKNGLDILSFSNISPGYRYFASCFVGWVFFGFVMLLITRESLYYISLRQQYHLLPFEKSRLSSRTILFVNVPEEARNEEHLRREYPGVANIWLVSVPKDLADSVEDCDSAARNLEAGEIKFIRNYVKRQKKLEKKSKVTEQSREINLKKDSPSHRLPKLKFLPVGKKVDTIDWSRGELARLVSKVSEEQLEHRSKSTPQSACFIEFENVRAAHDAFYQAVSKGKGMKSKVKMTPAEFGVEPGNVLWKNVVKKPATVQAINLVSTGFVAFLCIWWSIPVAAIGAISNINQLSDTVGFLSFLNSIPQVVMGFITGLLPVLLLSILMKLVPVICMLLAGLFCPTSAAVHLKVQGWYFPFQVVQVFLVTTFASGAASVVQSIIDNPAEAPRLLAQNLPTASNFYISYFILFGLITTVLQFLNVVPLLLVLVLGKLLDKTPRKMFNRYIQLAGVGWGPLYPKFTNLGVIALAYSCIAPLVLGFATVSFALMYLGYRYNCLFTFGTQVSTRGQCYARALQQLTTGLYLAEVCLIGLYALGIFDSRASIGPLVCMVVFLAATVVWQVLLNRHMSKMEKTFPDEQIAENIMRDGNFTGDVERYGNGYINGGSDGAFINANGYDGLLYAPGHKLVPQETRPSTISIIGSIKQFIKPKFAAMNHVGDIAPHLSTPVRPYTHREHRDAYMHPATVSETPMVWIARDEYGLSKKEVHDSKERIGKGFEMTDEGARLNSKGKINWYQDDLKQAPIWEDEPIY
ncbi:hypothetical protein S7711_09524 [Stachybotrys chartarum IBT 7711]|uniref:CSC1/OSCA1-like 7TM region domain-containing protein n=1 Tax=Stachybotrys chartarum (strain CBS 109288 / IBT 7711) TaxID=1280523 RepID=A0A084BBC1_STACB|nr:hypothetical protein S7711_09524 [Stachybotrys chartarum IBT 7711]